MISYNAFAEFDKAHYSYIVRLPDTISKKPFPGEPLACAVNVFKRGRIEKGQTVLVIGTGFLGCLLIKLLKNAGASVIAVSRRGTSLEFARKAGADHLVIFKEYYETIREIKSISGDGLTRVFEATGTQTALDLATDLVAERGTIIIAGYHQDGKRSINMQQWNWKGIDVVNAHERDPWVYISGLKEAITLTEEKVLDPNEFITHYFDLADINNAFQLLRDRPESFMKSVIIY
jgi:threonine dehydrogenase-like Zn-dependent dehydrogenase